MCAASLKPSGTRSLTSPWFFFFTPSASHAMSHWKIHRLPKQAPSNKPIYKQMKNWFMAFDSQENILEFGHILIYIHLTQRSDKHFPLSSPYRWTIFFAFLYYMHIISKQSEWGCAKTIDRRQTHTHGQSDYRLPQRNKPSWKWPKFIRFLAYWPGRKARTEITRRTVKPNKSSVCKWIFTLFVPDAQDNAAILKSSGSTCLWLRFLRRLTKKVIHLSSLSDDAAWSLTLLLLAQLYLYWAYWYFISIRSS